MLIFGSRWQHVVIIMLPAVIRNQFYIFYMNNLYFQVSTVISRLLSTVQSEIQSSERRMSKDVTQKSTVWGIMFDTSYRKSGNFGMCSGWVFTMSQAVHMNNNLKTNTTKWWYLLCVFFVSFRECHDFDCKGHRARPQHINYSKVVESSFKAKFL